jgi:hypothetical protein
VPHYPFKMVYDLFAETLVPVEGASRCGRLALSEPFGSAGQLFACPDGVAICGEFARPL